MKIRKNNIDYENARDKIDIRNSDKRQRWELPEFHKRWALFSPFKHEHENKKIKCVSPGAFFLFCRPKYDII